MSLLKDKNGKSFNYGDIILIDNEKRVLNENEEIEMIKMMRFQGYLHLFEREIELFLPYNEAIDKYPELYI